VQDRGWVGEKRQDEPPDGGIEKFVADDLIHVRLDKSHIAQPSLCRASLSACNRAGLTFDADYLSCWANQPGHDHGDVAHARAKLEDALAQSNAGLAEESLGDWSEQCGLPD
jgi:hypothetical protein